MVDDRHEASRMNKNDEDSGDGDNDKLLDLMDIDIINELVTNPNVSSTTLAEKLKNHYLLFKEDEPGLKEQF
jgi:hypothetical protein